MVPGKSYIRPSEWVLGVVLSLLAAAALVYGVKVGVTIPAGIAALILALLSILIASRSLGASRVSLRAGGGFSRLGSAIFGAGILIAVILPGVQLVLGTRKSRLEDNGFPTQDVGHDLALAFLIFTMALLAFWAGELLAEAIAMRKGRDAVVPSRPIGRPWETRATYWFLMVVGVVLIIASIGSDFSQRGTVTGQGVIQLFGYSAPLAIAIGILNRHWGSRFLAAVSLGVLAFLIAEGIRTPLLIIAAAAGVRYLYSTRTRRFGLREIVVIVLAIYVGSVMLVSLSAWRGQKNTGGDSGPPGDRGPGGAGSLRAPSAAGAGHRRRPDPRDEGRPEARRRRGDRPAQECHGVHPAPDLAVQTSLAVGADHAAVHQLRRAEASSYRGPDTPWSSSAQPRRCRSYSCCSASSRNASSAAWRSHRSGLRCSGTSSSASSTRAMPLTPTTCSGSASWS